MKIYAISLAIGVLVGAIYGLLHVRSPAPPVVALVGLAGMLIGEQIIPLGHRIFSGEALTVAAVVEQTREHVFGQLPHRRTAPSTPHQANERS